MGVAWGTGVGVLTAGCYRGLIYRSVLRGVSGVWRRWSRHGGRRDMRQTACIGSRGVVKHTASTTAKQRTKSI